MPRAPRLQRLTLSLLKEGMTRDDALQDGGRVTGYVVPAIDADNDSLFVASTPPHPPPWQIFLAPHVTGDLVPCQATFALLTTSRSLLSSALRFRQPM